MQLGQAINDFLEQCKTKELDAKTIKAYRTDLKQFLKLAEEENIKDVCDITESFLKKVHSGWLDSLKNSTVYRKNASLKVLMLYLWKQGYTKNNLYNMADITFKREKLDTPVVISSKDIKALLKRMESRWDSTGKEHHLRDLVLVEVFIYSGARISEISSLKWDDIILADESYILQFKGYRKRSVCIADKKADEHLRLYNELLHSNRNNNDSLFKNRDGKPMSEQSIRGVIKKNAKTLGLEVEVTPKVLRNTLALNMAKVTPNPKELQSFLGDKAFLSTERHLRKKEILPVHVVTPEVLYQ